MAFACQVKLIEAYSPRMAGMQGGMGFYWEYMMTRVFPHRSPQTFAKKQGQGNGGEYSELQSLKEAQPVIPQTRRLRSSKSPSPLYGGSGGGNHHCTGVVAPFLSVTCQ